ncbi:MAG: TetR family transcriptional regulator [Pseudonocardiaceae bacterium]|nr:TetR family transcriptional regulator [Pseudonocardiaceae bacterium]
MNASINMDCVARSKKHLVRREQLVNAAMRAINERGRDNLRIRDIAAEAGVSPGSVLYHYPELDELMFDVHRTVVEGFYQRRARLVEAETEPERRLATAIDTGLPAGRDDDVARTLYEMHGLADRSSLHSSLMTSLFDREVTLYSAVFQVGQASGRFVLAEPSSVAARTMVVLEDGFGLHLLSNNTSVDLAGARAVLGAYAQRVTGCDLQL